MSVKALRMPAATAPAAHVAPIRVAVIAESTVLGGVSKYSLGLAQGLNARPEVEISLLAFRRQDQSDVWLVEAARQAGVRLHLLPMRGVVDFSVIGRLARVLKHERINIVHTHGYKSTVMGRLAVQGYRLPIQLVGTVHGFPAMNVGRTRWYLALDLLLKRLFGDTLIAVSADTKAKLVHRGLPANKITVVNVGVEIPQPLDRTEQAVIRREFGLKADRLTLGFVGRLAPEKGIELLARVADQVLCRRPDVQLLVVGDGQLRSRLELLVRQFPKRVILAGAQHDIDRLYSVMDITLLTSQDGEGMPAVLLEAMSHGIPPLSTIIAGTPEVIEDGVSGFLFARDDAAGMVQTTLDLLQDPGLRRQIGHNARLRFEAEFTKPVMFKRTLGVYRSVLGVARNAGVYPYS
jgi:glycosyltransferase involved in cell wall biosynthesis